MSHFHVTFKCVQDRMTWCAHVLAAMNSGFHNVSELVSLIWNVPQQLKTPPQYADLNLIEHLWAILKPRVYEKMFLRNRNQKI